MLTMEGILIYYSSYDVDTTVIVTNDDGKRSAQLNPSGCLSFGSAPPYINFHEVYRGHIVQQNKDP